MDCLCFPPPGCWDYRQASNPCPSYLQRCWGHSLSYLPSFPPLQKRKWNDWFNTHTHTHKTLILDTHTHHTWTLAREPLHSHQSCGFLYCGVGFLIVLEYVHGISLTSDLLPQEFLKFLCLQSVWCHWTQKAWWFPTSALIYISSPILLETNIT